MYFRDRTAALTHSLCDTGNLIFSFMKRDNHLKWLLIKTTRSLLQGHTVCSTEDCHNRSFLSCVHAPVWTEGPPHKWTSSNEKSSLNTQRSGVYCSKVEYSRTYVSSQDKTERDQYRDFGGVLGSPKWNFHYIIFIFSLRTGRILYIFTDFWLTKFLINTPMWP